MESLSAKDSPPAASHLAPARIVPGSPQAQNIQLLAAPRRSAALSDRSVMPFPVANLLFVPPPYLALFASKRTSRSRWHVALPPSDPVAVPPPQRPRYY